MIKTFKYRIKNRKWIGKKDGELFYTIKELSISTFPEQVGLCKTWETIFSSRKLSQSKMKLKKLKSKNPKVNYKLLIIFKLKD